MRQLTAKNVRDFESKYTPTSTSECWEWKGSAAKRGYGHLFVNGAYVRAHRLAFFLYYGFISDDRLICHRCDNPPCVNPMHLFQGTYLTNNQDRSAKGRSCRGDAHPSRNTPGWNQGEKAGRAILNNEKVYEIRRLIAQGVSNCEIGRRYGVTNVTVSLIKRRIGWRHLPEVASN